MFAGQQPYRIPLQSVLA